jgi:membrane protease YdiL (CAAX protease family)
MAFCFCPFYDCKGGDPLSSYGPYSGRDSRQPADANENVYVPGYGFVPHPLRLAEKARIRRTAGWAAAALLATFIIFALIPALFYALSKITSGLGWSIWISPLRRPLISVITYCLAFTCPYWIYRSAVGIPLRAALPLKKPDASVSLPAIFVGLGASVFGALAAALVMLLLRRLGLSSGGVEISIPHEPGKLSLYLLNIALLPAVLEEMAFRGFLLQSLRPYGDGFALMISAFLFSLVHANPVQMPNAFLLGLVIGYFVLYTGSLWTGMLIHLANNLMVLLLVTFTDGLNEQAGLAVTLTVYGVYLLSGIAAAVYLTRERPRMFTLAPARTENREGEKLVAFLGSPWTITLMLVVAVLCFETVGGL